MDKTGKTVSIAVAAAALAVVWCVWGRQAASEAAYPVENGASWFSRRVAAPLRGLFDGAAAAAEADALRREVDGLRMSQADCEALFLENARLRKALYGAQNMKPRGKWTCAPVLSHGGAAGARRTIRAGRGSRDGVKPGCAVAAPDGLVGRVAEVSPHASTILLAEDEGSKVACVFAAAGGKPAYGIVSGGGVRRPDGETALPGLYAVEPMRMGNLPPEPGARPGAEVRTSGLGGVFPAGIKVGTVVETRMAANGICAEALVKPAVDPRALDDVFILVEGP